MRRRRITARLEVVVGAALWALLPLSVVSGQRVTGSVRESASGVPVVGAVVSVLDSAGQPAARTLTDERGRYTIVWRANGARLRIVRLGFRPAGFALPPGPPRDTTIDVIMERLPVALEAVHVSSDAVCGDSPNARAALDLWEQARSALLSAIVAREANPAQMVILSYERQLDLRDRRVTQQRSTVASGQSRRPFLAARPAPILAAEGYMQRLTSGQIYLAPDADVMFDESFAGAHCFGVEIGKDERRGQIGLTFVPRARERRGAFVDVRGVLWVDVKTPALVQLEYKYTGVEMVGERAGMGGTLHFLTMKNGVVFIDAWSIDLPLIKNTFTKNVGGDTTVNPVLVGLSESGGFVLSAVWPDSLKWIGKIGAIRGRVSQRQTAAGVPGAVVTLVGVGATITDTAGDYSLTMLPPGRYGLQVSDSSFGQFLRPRNDGRDATVTLGDTVLANFEVTSHASLIEALCKGEKSGPKTSVILGHLSDGRGAWPKDLRVETAWQDDIRTMSTSFNIDVVTAKQTIDVDDAGRFHACGVVRERPIRLRVLLGRVYLADTILKAADTGPVRSVEWSVRAGLFASAQEGDGSSLTGVVVRDDGGPVFDAEVSVIGTDATARTDSAGRYQLVGLPRGKQLVQVRRLGYSPRRDTVTLRPREGTTRQFALEGQVTSLDTMRTTSGMVKYISPALRAFEERRAQGFGRFVSEADMRKNDNMSIAALLPTRMSGLSVIASGAGSYATTSRAGSADPNDTTKRADPNNPKSPIGCWVALYLDGVAIYTGFPQAAPDLSTMRVSEYAGAEYYSSSSTIPPQYNHGPAAARCGVLLLWTRER